MLSESHQQYNNYNFYKGNKISLEDLYYQLRQSRQQSNTADVDRSFLQDLQNLRRFALPPTNDSLDLSNAQAVWQIIRVHNPDWGWAYVSKSISATVYFRNSAIIEKKIQEEKKLNYDYFYTLDNLLQFVHDQFVANGEDIAGYIKFAGMVKNNPKDYSKLCSKVKEATNNENQPFKLVAISPNHPLVGKDNEDVADHLNLLVSNSKSPPLQNSLLEQVKQSQGPLKSDEHDLCNFTIQYILKYNFFERSSEDEPPKCTTCHGLVGWHKLSDDEDTDKKQVRMKTNQNNLSNPMESRGELASLPSSSIIVHASQRLRQNWSQDEEDAFLKIFTDIGKPVEGNKYKEHSKWGRCLKDRSNIQIREKYKSLKKLNKIS